MGILASKEGGGPQRIGNRIAVPSTEPRMGPGNRQFSEWFRILFRAVEHELGNSLAALRALALQHGPEGEILANGIFEDYGRLRFLQSCASNAIDETRSRNFAVMFPQAQFDIRDLDGDSLFVQIRSLSLTSVRSLRVSLSAAASLLHADAGQEQKFHLDRAIDYGNLLCHALEKLILDDFDFSCECIAVPVSGKGSILKSAEIAAREAAVVYSPAGPDAACESLKVVSNPLFLKLILANIYSNAKRALENANAEGIVLVSAAKKNDSVSFRFIDRGCGMDAQAMEKLNCGIQTSTKGGEGHGIGFSYCRTLAEKLGGRLYVESSGPGLGTTIALELKISGEA